MRKLKEKSIQKTKLYGQYFTPKKVADFMVSLISHPRDAKVLEPSAGEGIFLKSLWEAGFRNIVAYEVDRALPNKSPVPIEYRNFLEVPVREEFDVVIGNPPYVRWKNIPEGWRNMFKTNPYWDNIINGLGDLTYAFIYHSVNMLKPGGELIFITPVFWTETVHGKRLREYLMKHGDLELLINFNEMRIFPKVSSTIIIFKYVKEKRNRPVKIVNLHTKEKLAPKHLKKVRELLGRLEGHNGDYIREGIYEAYIHSQFEDGEPWKPLPPNNSNPLIRLETERPEILTPLGEMADIGNGMVSGLDKAFVLNPDELRTLTPEEKRRIIWVYKAKTLNRVIPEKPPIPYIYANDIEEESVFKRLCPNFYTHLLPYKDKLLARYNYGRDIPWWHWVFPRNKHLFENHNEKILIPSKERYDSRGYFRFTYIHDTEDERYYATQDVTVIVLKDGVKESTKYVVGLLNSSVYQDYILHKGFSRGGVYDFSERPLAIIPIIRIDFSNEEEVRIHDEIVATVEKIIKTKKPSEYISRIDECVTELIRIKEKI